MHLAGEVALDGAADSVPRARHLAAELRGPAAAVRGDVELVVSELTTNACLHGQAPITVRVLTADDAVRVEVADAGRAMPVLPRANPGAMTGRGFALVTALTRAWGVEPARTSGKTVWAEVPVTPLRAGQGGGPDEVRALTQWPDEIEAAATPLFTVHLGAVPTELLLAAKSHIDDVVRELKLAEADAERRDDALPEPARALMAAVTEDFAMARAAIKRQALESAARGDVVTELTLRLPLSAADAGERYLSALDEIDRQSRAGRILTLVPPRSHRTFRRWYLRALIDQLRAVANGDPPPAAEPFPQVLARQVDDLAALLETQTRLRLLQTLTRRLAEATSAEEMAQAVVETAGEYDGVESARVFTLTDHATLKSIAWFGGPPGTNLYDEFPLDDELPGAVVVRTGEPMHVRTLGELYGRFPRLAEDALYPSERSLHSVPMTVAGHVIGLLSLTFRAGEVTDEAQVGFVTAIADSLAQAIERAAATQRADDERSRELALLSAQADALAGVVSGRPLVEVLDDLLLAIEAASTDGLLASVLLLSDDGRHLRHGSAPSLPGDYNAAIDGIEIGPSVGSCGTAAHRRERVVVEDVLVDPLWAPFRDLAQASGLRACWSTPIFGSADELLGTFALYYRQPHGPGPADLAFIDVMVGTVALIIERSRGNDGSGSRLADEAAQQLAVEIAISAGGIGTFDWNLGSGELVWDEQLLGIFGQEPEARRSLTIDEFWLAVHPGDRDRVREQLTRAIDTFEEFDTEYRILLADGSTRWVAARGRAVIGRDGTASRFVGAAYDTTARRESEARVARVMDSLSTAFFFLDRHWRFTFVNGAAERVLGRRREELLGKAIWDEFPAAAGSDFERHYRSAAESGEPVAFDAFYPEPLNAWYEVRAWPNPDGLAVYFLDVTDRRAAQDAAQRAIDRAGLLASVSEQLARTLDPQVAMRALAELVVPELGDWCVVTLIDDDRHAGTRRGLGEAYGWHVDPGLRDLVSRYAAIRLPLLTEDGLIVRAVETGDGQIVNGNALAELRSMFAADAEPLRILEQLDTWAIAVLPLIGQERPVGMLSVVTTTARGTFTEEELRLLREVAARAGLVLDRARLYRQQRQVAEQLQRSLLQPPQADAGVQVAVRYVAAAEAAQVGGDWYDTFRLPDGGTCVVIGDVMGHDVLAAAAMGEARTLIRALAAENAGAPGPTLDSAERVMRLLKLDTLATVLVGRLAPNADGTTTLTYSNAGHPPPIVVGMDGTLRVLDEPDTNTLLGVGTGRHVEHVTRLPPGATLALYTDGLVERRTQSLDVGIRQLADVLVGVAAAPPEQVADEVLRGLVPDHPDDDVALLVIRVSTDASAGAAAPRLSATAAAGHP